MQRSQTDKFGRATFHHIAPQQRVRPTEREIRWLKHIERHGPQSSRYLYELTRDTHRCKDTSLRRMQKLRAGDYLMLPRQQRATERAEFNPYIYDLTKKAKTHLYDFGIAEPTVRPTGHWWHSYMTSCITSSIDIASTRDGVRYIPAHEILEEKQIIRQRGLLKTKLLDRRPADAKNDARDEKFELRVEHLMNEQLDRFLCATPSKSKIYEETLLDALAQMKLWLDDNAETGSCTVVEF